MSDLVFESTLRYGAETVRRIAVNLSEHDGNRYALEVLARFPRHASENEGEVRILHGSNVSATCKVLTEGGVNKVSNVALTWFNSHGEMCTLQLDHAEAEVAAGYRVGEVDAIMSGIIARLKKELARGSGKRPLGYGP